MTIIAKNLRGGVINEELRVRNEKCKRHSSLFNLQSSLACLLGAVLAFATSSAYADLVAKWDFNNYDPSDPKSANVLQATIGSDAKPR